VFAFNTANNHLLEKVNVHKSMFYNVHDQTALTLAKIIDDEAKACGAALNDYDVNATLLTELNNAVAQVEELINAPSSIRRECKLYTSNLRELFVAADSILYDKLDKLVRLCKTFVAGVL
jgi:predicted RNA-binding Zn ribbon-like protein